MELGKRNTLYGYNIFTAANCNRTKGVAKMHLPALRLDISDIVKLLIGCANCAHCHPRIRNVRVV